MSTEIDLAVGVDFLGYRIEEEVARGGMGVVYRAYDRRLKRTVALKFIAPELALDARFRERFLREAEIAAAIEHPNVVPVHDAGEDEGRLYLAMRYVEGTSLRSLLRSNGPLDPTRALAICSQVARALDAAHARRLVHRDVKPSNVLLDESEHVYLADFGLARLVPAVSQPDGERRSLGTPAYVAPEVLAGEYADGRADIYSLGCVLYECLTGKPPFTQSSPLALAWAHLEEEPPAPSTRNPKLPSQLDAVLARAMAKDPAHRYPRCGALVADARAVLGLDEPAPSARRRAIAGSAAAVVVIGATVAAVALVRELGDTGTTTPVVRADTLVRVDPATNAVTDVVGVGRTPVAAAAARDTVWVFNWDDDTVSAVDTGRNDVRGTTRLEHPPDDRLVRLSSRLRAGPVLAAGERRAWMVGSAGRARGVLTRVTASGDARGYPIRSAPRAVAVGGGSVWVLSRRARKHYVLRVDPATGSVLRAFRIPTAVPLDGLAFGFGHAWTVAPSTGTVYRVDPAMGELEEVNVGPRAGRLQILGPTVLVEISGEKGDGGVAALDPESLVLTPPLPFFRRAEASTNAGAAFGSVWWADRETATLVRLRPPDSSVSARPTNIPLGNAPSLGGPCLTSVTASSEGIWVTAAAEWVCADDVAAE